jgi:hypothetical protein
LSVNVGVPPATVTALLILSVSVTVLPAFRSPVEGESAIELSVGRDELVVGPDELSVGPDPDDAAEKPASM